jgi:predicted alpha/beta superfamily hydrolase
MTQSMMMLRAVPLLSAVLAAGVAEGAVAAQEPVPPHETFTIESTALGETRRINVYTPPGYAEDAAAHHPVLYMPDGGVQEDFPHVASTVDAGIRAGEMRAMIVVGIENTERRRDMTGPTEVEEDRRIAPRVGGSAAFRAFIADELMPEVRRRYRTTDETAIIGESLAGLFIVETFVLQPELFDTYVALSPSLWWNGGALLQTAGERLPVRGQWPATVYLSSADEDNIAPAAARLAQALQEHPQAGLRWHYRPRPDLTHGTIYRAEAPRVLRALFAPLDSAALARAVAATLASALARRNGDPTVVHAGETAFDSAVAALLLGARGTIPPSPRESGTTLMTRGFAMRGEVAAVLVAETVHDPSAGCITTYIEENRYLFVPGPGGWEFVGREFVRGMDLGGVPG